MPFNCPLPSFMAPPPVRRYAAAPKLAAAVRGVKAPADTPLCALRAAEHSVQGRPRCSAELQIDERGEGRRDIEMVELRQGRPGLDPRPGRDEAGAQSWV